MGLMPVLELEGITFSYPSRGKVLDGLSLRVMPGEKVGITGPNGSGKTTLLLITVGLLKPDSGTVKLFGREMRGERDFREARLRIGFLFQDSDDQLFCPTVEEDIAFGPLNQGRSEEEVREIVREVVSILGLEGFERRFSHKLSYGEKRLVALGTALAMRPELFLLDEPTTGLDPDTCERITKILDSIDKACCIVSHDIGFLKRVAHRIYRLEGGRLRPMFI